MPDPRTDRAAGAPEPGPVWAGRTDLGRPADLEVPRRFTAARLLVTRDDVPVGQVELPLTAGRASAGAIGRAVAAVSGTFPGPGSGPPPVSDEPVTVVVATRGRPLSVLRCVRAVLAGDHPAVTVLVVDNDPPDDRTERAVATVGDARVRYVRELRRGASAGRNRGLREARTPVVAFTDDDTEPDRAWASRIAGAFAADPELTGVSGPVLAARLGTPQEQAADVALAWNKGFAPRRFSLAQPPEDSAVFPFSPGLFGIGANMAVRREAVRSLGGFDEALGPGAGTAGGEDIELLVRIVLDGQVLGYAPSAFVWHHHRPSDGELRSQMRGYARGLGAFLGKVALDRRARAVAVRRIPAAVSRLRHIVRRESGEVGATAGAHPVRPPSADAGTDQVGTDQVGTDQVGTDQAGTDQAGTDQAGTDQAGTDQAGTSQAGTDRAGTDRTDPGDGDADGTNRAADALPGGAAGRKLRGLLTGPVLFLRSRRRVRDTGGTTPPLTRPDT